MQNYQRVMSIEDDFVTVRDAPFEEDGDSTSLPAVAIDWNAKQAAFNVTLLSINADGTERLWSESFSISKIQKRHLELCLVHPELLSQLPKLPKDPQGIWGYIRLAYVPPELCKKLEEYLKEAFNICGWKLFSSVFFGEPLYFDENYTISSWELKRKQLVKDSNQLLHGFQEHFSKKNKASSLGQLYNWYEVSWDSLAKLNDAEGKLLAFDCEPYEELRDIAQRERSECASMFNRQSVTASTFQTNAQNFNQWEEQYIEAVKKINEYRITQMTTSLGRLQQMLDLLQNDRDTFTDDDTSTIVSTKLYQLRKECLQKEIEILNFENQLKLFERDNIRRDALALEEDLSMPQKLNEKEALVYKKQCEILTTNLEIQDKSETMVLMDLEKLAKEEDNNVFEKVKATLTKRFTAISRKKAILRNNKKVCEEEIRKLARKEEFKQEQYVAHHAVQMKIEKRRQEEDENREARVQEREKTLLRLKQYKKKYSKPKEVKPPRYQPPSARKQEQKVKNNDTLETYAQPSLGINNAVSRKDKTSNRNRLIDNTTMPDASSLLPEDVYSPKSSNGEVFSPTPPQSAATVVPSPPSLGTVCPPPPPPPPPLPSSVIVPPPNSSMINKSSAGQASSLSQRTLDLDALKVARSCLKKQDNTATTLVSNNNRSGFPSGNELTRAIQSVKLRQVVHEQKPAELSPDGAEFLKKALERMNKFTTLSFEEDEVVEDQEW